MASNSNSSPFNIGNYVIVNDRNYGYVMQIDNLLRIVTILNAITNDT